MVKRNTKCICTFAQKTVGDGCDFCNPGKALDYAYDTINDLEAERDALKELNGELAEALTVFVESDTAQVNLPYECEHAERIVNKAREVTNG